MLRVYLCITAEHDLRLVALAALVCAVAALAALVCAVAALTAVTLLHHVLRSPKADRYLWLAVAAVTTGFGIWTTHFIAMLAFQPALPTGYDVPLTVISLAAAIALTGLGIGIGVSRQLRFSRWIGGAVVGGGIATMHYTGMAAFETTGRVVWDVPLVAASLALGGLLAAAALPAALRADTPRWRALGTLLLTLAICIHHFTAMGAAIIVPDLNVIVSEAAFPAETMALVVASMSLAIVALAFAGLAVERRYARMSSEKARMRELADAVIEGLIVCDGDKIVSSNRSFAALACAEGTDDANQRSLAAFFPAVTPDELARNALKPMEATLRATDGSTIAVELIYRDFVYEGKPHQILAVRDIRERKQAEEDIRFLAHHDGLTNLPNRTSFNKRLEAELAAHHGTDRRFAVMFVDLDRFKEINDLFGHAAGDAVLQFVAERVRGALAPDHLFARLGGDEFAVIAPGLTEPAEAVQTAGAILAALGEPSDSLPADIGVGASIGIALYPDDATDRSTLLSHADAALYEAKAEGRGGCRRFEASMGAQLRERREMQHDVRHALARGELSLVYQPQADTLSGEVLGFEALLRWTHGTRGPISPGVFIPLAEECGAILPIGEWVLRTACAAAAGWARPLSIAVNVSAVQLHSSDLPQLVEEVLRDTGLEPSRLELEITETALIKDFGRAVAAVRELKALGVKIAMDDFGTGYSSLSNLRAFPFDKIKIDKSFIHAVDTSDEAATIVRAVLGLARGLKLPVLAEGVETNGELWFLRLMECDAIQGYLLARPGPISQFNEHTRGTAANVVQMGEGRPPVAAHHRARQLAADAAVSA